jgi:flagellar motility protein MotE (MotC chaperone)
MGKFVLTVLLAFLLVHCLALVGLLGYGAATGRFSSEKRAQYLATWHGEKLVPPTPEVVVETKKESPQQASSRIATAEIDKEVDLRESQRELELLRSMQLAIDAAKSKLDKDLKQLDVDRADLAARIEEQNKLAKEEGFLKALKNYTQMKPKMVKDDFMKMDDQQVVRFLAAMKSDTATKILNQFKTTEEQDKRLRIMEMLKQYNVVALNDKSGPVSAVKEKLP